MHKGNLYNCHEKASLFLHRTLAIFILLQCRFSLSYSLESSIDQSSVKIKFERLTAQTSWPGRRHPQIHRLRSPLSYMSITFPPQSLVLYGGSTRLINFNDVWLSSNIVSWFKISGSEPTFPQRPAFCLCNDPKADRLYAIPENMDATFHTGVVPIYTTSNLVNWTSVVPEALPSNYSASATAFLDHQGINCVVDGQSRLYYLMGTNGTAELPHPQMYNQTWRSQDFGSHWNLRTSSIPFTPRYDALSEIHVNNSHLGGIDILYIIGGVAKDPDWQFTLRDIWVSSDGATTWVQLSPSLPWPGSPQDSTFIITKDGILIVSTYDVYISPKSLQSNIYSSFDGGISWHLCAEEVVYGPRSAVGLDLDPMGSLYVFGGYGVESREYLNDIWKSNLSVYDWTAWTAACGTVVPKEGVGLARWPQPDLSSSSSSSTGSRSSISSMSSSSSSLNFTLGSSSSPPPISVESSSSSTGSTEVLQSSHWSLWTGIIIGVLTVISGLGLLLYFRYVKRKYGRIQWLCCRRFKTTDSAQTRLIPESEL